MTADRPTGSMHVRRRYHFQAAGLIYIFVTVLVALGAFNSQNNLLFWLFGFALAVLVVSGFISGAMLMGLRVERDPVPDGAAGERLTITYRVSNHNRLIPAFALTILETDEPIRLPPPKASRRTPTTRPTWARPTWSAFFPRPHAFVAHVGPGETVRAQAVVRPDRRGHPVLTTIRVETAFPFGIVTKSLIFVQESAATILPALLPLRSDLLPRTARHAARDTAPQRRLGTGDEFFALREYIPGDSPATIAWKPSARTDRLLVRQNAAPTPLRLWITLRFPPGRDDLLDERAIGLAASLLHLAHERRLEVGLAIPAAGIRHTPVPAQGGGGRRHLHRLLTDLALLDLAQLGDRPERGDLARPSDPRAMHLVVHAGPADPSFGPPHARHLTATDPAAFLAPTDVNPTVERARPAAQRSPRPAPLEGAAA